MNLKEAPFNDERVRRAVYLVFDRQALLKGWVSGKGVQGAPFVPGTWMSASDAEMATWPGHRYVDSAGNPVLDIANHTGSLIKDPRDIAEAKRLMVEAGFPEGFKDTEMVFGRSTEEAAVFLKKDLAQLGITTSDLTVPRAEFFERWNGGGYGILHVNYSLSIMDPDDILGGIYLPGGSRNPMDLTVPGFEDLAGSQKSIVNRTERRKVITSMEDIIRGATEQTPHWIQSIYGKFTVWPVHNNIKNFRPCFTLQQCLNFDHLWLGEDVVDNYK